VTFNRNRIMVLLSLMLVIAISVYALLLYYSPIPIKVIDSNSSGFVSIFEAINSYDVGRRPSVTSPGCTEIYWLKDGLPATIECPKPVSRTL
jgi:hypothetical protein